jgi:hypothetical protein
MHFFYLWYLKTWCSAYSMFVGVGFTSNHGASRHQSQLMNFVADRQPMSNDPQNNHSRMKAPVKSSLAITDAQQSDLKVEPTHGELTPFAKRMVASIPYPFAPTLPLGTGPIHHSHLLRTLLQLGE